ncbi:MAG: HpcH/HpaI aldolase family protein [Candidatus Aminicenantales bacterium]
MTKHDARDFKERLKSADKLTGILLSLPSPEIAEICASAGFDWLFLDMEHGLLDFQSVQRMIQAVAGKSACIVRVPANEPIWIAKALDTGADGLIFPHINRAEEARTAVAAARYSPEGSRSIGLARAQGYGARVAEALKRANKEIVLIAQAEHIDAAGNIEGILSVDGVDAVFIGPFDLSASLGLPGRTGDPRVREAIGRIGKACAARGIPSGIFGGDAQAARNAAGEGFSLICVSTDTLLLGGAARNLLAEVRK